MRRIVLCGAMAGAVMLACLGFVQQAEVKADISTVVGTWLITTTPNMPPGAPPLSFNELAAFNIAGTLTDTHAIAHSSQNMLLPPPLDVDSSDAYGVWQRVGLSNQFATTHKRLLFAGSNTPSAFYGVFVPGQHVGFETVQTVLTLQSGPNGEVLSGPFTVEFTNLAGHVVFSDFGTVSATRVKLEPLATP